VHIQFWEWVKTGRKSSNVEKRINRCLNSPIDKSPSSNNQTTTARNNEHRGSPRLAVDSLGLPYVRKPRNRALRAQKRLGC
jgi:hypothetical protein